MAWSVMPRFGRSESVTDLSNGLFHVGGEKGEIYLKTKHT